MPSPIKMFEPSHSISWGGREESWVTMPRFQGFMISTFGNVKDFRGDDVEPYFNADGELCISLERYEWSYNGHLWKQMLRHFWHGNREGVEFRYEDGDETNLHINNLTPMYRNENGELEALKWRIDDHGNRVIDRRLGTKMVRIVETGDTYNTVKEVAEAIGGNATSVYSVLRGRAKSHRGFTFVMVDPTEEGVKGFRGPMKVYRGE